MHSFQVNTKILYMDDTRPTHFFDLPVELQAIILKDGYDIDSVIRRWVCRA